MNKQTNPFKILNTFCLRAPLFPINKFDNLTDGVLIDEKKY